RFRDACPFCGTPAPAPERRGPPDQVEGVLALLDDETLARLRGERVETAEEMMTRLVGSGLPARFAGATVRKHRERLEVLSSVEGAMGLLGGVMKARGLSDVEMQRFFWYTFGIDVLSAKRLDKDGAKRLLERITDYLSTCPELS